MNRSNSKIVKQYLSPPLPQFSPSASSSTESFACPSLDEAAQIFHVYSLLDRVGGVYGDGQVEGVELTRDGRAQACFASAQQKQHWEERLEEARFGPAEQRRWSVEGNMTLDQPIRETDRYGFFIQPTKKNLHESSSVDQRSALLKGESFALASTEASTSALPSPKPVYTPLRPAHSPTAEELEKENRRVEKWLDMLAAPRAGPSDGAAWTLKGDILSSQGGKNRVGLTSLTPHQFINV